MAETIKLKDPYDDPSITEGPSGSPVVVVPEVSVGPTLSDPYDNPNWQAANASSGVKLPLSGEQPKHPYYTAAIRGLAGAPGVFVDMANFAANMPKYLMDIGGSAVEKGYNLFNDPIDLPRSSELLPFKYGDINIPGGSEDWKKWLGAPAEEPADTAAGRVLQAGIEGGLSSIGPGFAGALGKKMAPHLFENKNFLREMVAPSHGPLPNQIALDTTSGGLATMGGQAGNEVGDNNLGMGLSLLGGLAPSGAAGARRLAREHLFGVSDPAEIQARLNQNIGRYLPEDYRYDLADKLGATNMPGVPGVDFTPYQMIHDPYLGAIDTTASRIDPISMSRQDQTSRNAIADFGRSGSPGGDVELPKQALESRVAQTEAGLATREQKIGADAESIRQKALANKDVEDWRIDWEHRNDIDAADKARIAQEQQILNQYEGEKVAAAGYADSVGAPDAANARNQASRGIHESITRQGQEAKTVYGGKLGAYAEDGDVKVPGEELIKIRAQMQKDILDSGTGGLPKFLQDRKNNPMATPSGDMLDDYLYVGDNTIDKAAAAGAASKPQQVSVKQMIGWDQRLRAEASEAFEAKDMARYQRIKELRGKVNGLIDDAMGDTQYQSLKKEYNDHVARRFYTDTIDDFLTPGAVTPEEAGARTLNASRKGAQAATDTLKAIGNDPDGVKALVDYTAADMVSYAYNPKTGMLDGGKLKKWMDQRSPMIQHLRDAGSNGDAVAKQITDNLDAIQRDQTLLEATILKAKENTDTDIANIREQFGGYKWSRTKEAQAEHRDVARQTAEVSTEQKAREQGARKFTQWGNDMVARSAARFALGNDPEHMASSLLRSSDLTRDANSMSRLLRRDPDAVKGMQQAIYDQFMTDTMVRLEKGGMKTATEIDEMIKPYATLEQNGLLPPGSVQRFKTMLAAEWHLNTPRAAGAQVDQDLANRLMVISGASRGVGGARFGNALTAAVRGIYGPRETEMIHKILRDAALDPAKMQELLRAEAKGQVELKAVVARQLATMGYKPVIERPE